MSIVLNTRNRYCPIPSSVAETVVNPRHFVPFFCSLPEDPSAKAHADPFGRTFCTRTSGCWSPTDHAQSLQHPGSALRERGWTGGASSDRNCWQRASQLPRSGERFQLVVSSRFRSGRIDIGSCGSRHWHGPQQPGRLQHQRGTRRRHCRP